MEAFSRKKYTCIVYPGIVKDEEKMISSLGGLEAISMVCSMPNRRLELRFRPGDVYCRSACGDRQKILSFLLKVKIRRKKQPTTNDDASTDDAPQEILSYEPIVMGRVETTFNFKSLCDFQYLPLEATEKGVENIYSQLIPKGFPPTSWFHEPSPSFLPPAAFSRMDSVQMYLYRKESKDSKTDHTPPNIIGRTRCRRSAHAVFVTFDVPAAPSKPRVNALKYLELKFLAGEPYSKLQKLFEERPIWSKTALAFETKYKRDQLKFLLPAVAYYFVTGPFRVMWVRMGYDPRKDTSSRIYQTLDYRIPNRGGLCRLVKAKRRTDSMLPYKSVSSAQSKTITILKDTEKPAKDSTSDSSTQDQVHYIFQRGVKLPARQMFYQYCDIKVPEVEEMFARLPKPSPDVECHRQRGWLPAGFAERVREIITNIIFEELEKEKAKSKRGAIAGSSSTEQDDDFEEDDEDDEDEDDDDDEDDDFTFGMDNNSDNALDDDEDGIKGGLRDLLNL